MTWTRGKILPFTLTEIFTLLFFALALALVYQWIKRADAEQLAKEHESLLAVAQEIGPEASGALAEAVNAAQGSVPEDFKELIRRFSSDARARKALQTALREGGLDSAFVDTASMNALVDSLIARHEEAERRANELAAIAAGDGSSRDAVEALSITLSEARAENERLNRENENLRNQLRHIGRRGNGLDHPPCWADANGRPEYALRVVLYTNEVTVHPAWPPHRERDALEVDGLIQAVGEHLSWEEFSRRATPVLLWSQRQDPECRHFVILVDSVAGGKEAFKRGMLTVEHFFYKYLAN